MNISIPFFFTHYYNGISDTKLIFFMAVFFNKLLIVYFWGVYYFQIRLYYFWFCWLPLKTATLEREVLKCGYFTLMVIAIIDLLQRCATVLNRTFLLYIFKFLGTVFCEDNSSIYSIYISPHTILLSLLLTRPCLFIFAGCSFHPYSCHYSDSQNIIVIN